MQVCFASFFGGTLLSLLETQNFLEAAIASAAVTNHKFRPAKSHTSYLYRNRYMFWLYRAQMLVLGDLVACVRALLMFWAGCLPHRQVSRVLLQIVGYYNLFSFSVIFQCVSPIFLSRFRPATSHLWHLSPLPLTTLSAQGWLKIHKPASPCVMQWTNVPVRPCDLKLTVADCSALEHRNYDATDLIYFLSQHVQGQCEHV